MKFGTESITFREAKKAKTTRRSRSKKVNTEAVVAEPATVQDKAEEAPKAEAPAEEPKAE